MPPCLAGNAWAFLSMAVHDFCVSAGAQVEVFLINITNSPLSCLHMIGWLFKICKSSYSPWIYLHDSYVYWFRNSDSWLWEKHHASGPRASPFHSFNWHETGNCWFGTYLTCCRAIRLSWPFFPSGYIVLACTWQQRLEMSMGLFRLYPQPNLTCGPSGLSIYFVISV